MIRITLTLTGALAALAFSAATAHADPDAPTPTNAVRNTAGCSLKTASPGIVNIGPAAVSIRCDLRPQNHRRPCASKYPTSPIRWKKPPSFVGILASAVACGRL